MLRVGNLKRSIDFYTKVLGMNPVSYTHLDVYKRQALHQYPAGNYAALANTLPDVIDDLVPGSLGENLSVAGWDETNVCIGDIFQLGGAVIQVSQPRTPCWKIDSRFGLEGMTQYIHCLLYTSCLE